ncbi:hypothetical protein KY310_03370 [Candidatus Woesearchaeota archaeon]|nr:hypothetical protein [Candidatus Woesearchaeota archaeon]
METKTAWPGSKQDKPAGWGDWSEEARAAFAKIWETADEKLRADLLKDIEERKGNQKELEEYFIFLKESKGSFGEDDEHIGAIGCPLTFMLVLIVPAIILGAVLL